MNSTADRISASGRVVRVAPTYAYIYSEQHGSIFSYPAAFFNYLETPSPTSNLTDVLRVDDVVHFVAVPQNGPNDCRWIAVKITKKQKQQPVQSKSQKSKSAISSNNHANQSDELPEVLQSVLGTIIELHNRNGMIYSEKYGKVYFPMAAAVTLLETNELHPLDTLFENGAWVLFDAQRQPCKNDCRYVATRVQNVPVDYQVEDTVTTHVTGHLSDSASKTSTIDEKSVSTGDLSYEEGEIIRLFPQYGFIRSEKLGTVFFTLAHFEIAEGQTLMDQLALGDKVQFIPMAQEEKSGCKWRGIKVRKLDSDLIMSLAQLVDGSGSVDDQTLITCEVSTQTDQSLWNTFLASQATIPRRRGDRRTQQVVTEDASCQTRTPPEALLLKAVKEDGELKAVLEERFPHLMRFFDKTT